MSLEDDEALARPRDPRTEASSGSLVPLYGFVAGDTLGVLVLVQRDDTVAEVARVAQAAAAVRVAPRDRARVLLRGVALDPRLTVAAAGLVPLDRIDVIAEER